MDLTSPDFYNYWYEEKLRFSDIDMLGHVNNVAIAALIETGRVSFGRDCLGFSVLGHVIGVMARIEIDYRRELHFPALVRIGSRLTRIGRTSVAIANGVFKDEACAASSVTTLVLIDAATRRPVPIADAERARLEALLPIA